MLAHMQDIKSKLRKVRRHWLGFLARTDLPRLAALHSTDKWGRHFYAQHYQKHFAAHRTQAVNVLEIGVGGYDNPRLGGASLRMWKDYFRRGHIYSLDIFDKSALQEERVTIFRGSQDDVGFLKAVVEAIGRIDIVIDDGSHINSHVIQSFEVLFPALSPGGIYVIEDLQTAYWKKYGGSEDTSCSRTSIAMCKRLVDGLNWQEFFQRTPGQFDKEICGLHFYHNIVFVEKGPNLEMSNKKPDCQFPAEVIYASP